MVSRGMCVISYYPSLTTISLLQVFGRGIFLRLFVVVVSSSPPFGSLGEFAGEILFLDIGD